jgi:ketosteroid isomerase-like protein
MGSTGGISADEYVGIQRLVHRYADAVVHRDPERWSATWADDAVWDLTRGRRVQGRAAIVDLWRSAMRGMHAVVQTVDNGDVWRGDDGVVEGRWYFTETFRRADAQGNPIDVGILRAHYDDAYLPQDGGWLFARRELVIHYVGPADLSAPFLNTHERFGATSV